MSGRNYINIEPTIKERICTRCGNTIPKKTYCLVTVAHTKRSSYCAECILILSSELLQHHNVSEIKERVIERLI